MGDKHEEEMSHLPLNRLCHVSTVQFAYRGKLLGATKSHYFVDDAVCVFDTGDLTAYMGGPDRKDRGSAEARMGRLVLVERAATTAVWILD